MPASTQRPILSPLRIRVAPEEVTLSSWGLRDLGWYGWANLLLAAVVACAVGWLTGWPLAGWGVLALLLLSLWRFWLPIRFELGPHGITQTVLSRTTIIPWTAIRSYEVRRKGVLLFADAVLTPLSPLRALYLPWAGDREQVLGHIEYYLTTWTHGERSTELP
jgi:hypothetical protein